MALDKIPDATELILIRHGETDWNRELRFQGQLDVPLNAIGFEQALRVAQRMTGEQVHQLISSDLLRARQTATASQQILGLALQSDAGLREQGSGVVDGMSVAEVQQKFPQAWNRWIGFDPDYAFDGGETTRAFHARVIAALQRLSAGRTGQRLVVVTHGGVLDMVYRSATGQPLSGPRQGAIPNGGVSRVLMRQDTIEILSWGETSHLTGLPDQPVYDQSHLAAVDQTPTQFPSPSIR